MRKLRSKPRLFCVNVYGKDGYFFAYRFDGINLVLPPKPQLEGKDITGLKDANGVFYVRELVNTGKTGAGYVAYLFDKPSKGKPVSTSYVGRSGKMAMDGRHRFLH